MDDERFQASLALWRAMPGDVADQGYLARPYPGPLDAKLDALCMLYLEASAAQQETLARLIAGVPGASADGPARAARCDALLGYIRRAARCIKAAGDGSVARLGLAAAALAAEGADARDVLEACAFLRYAATQAGIDLAPMIETLAAPSPPQAQRLLTALRKSDEATITRIVRYHEGTG